VLSVHNNVENSVELISGVMVGKFERVATRVTLEVFFIVAVLVVKGLMDIADIVDEQTECVGFSLIRHVGVKTVLNVVVNVTIEVVLSIVAHGEPLHESGDTLSEIAGLVSGVVLIN
jgi:hypothetical protein